MPPFPSLGWEGRGPEALPGPRIWFFPASALCSHLAREVPGEGNAPSAPSGETGSPCSVPVAASRGQSLPRGCALIPAGSRVPPRPPFSRPRPPFPGSRGRIQGAGQTGPEQCSDPVK